MNKKDRLGYCTQYDEECNKADERFEFTVPYDLEFVCTECGHKLSEIHKVPKWKKYIYIFSSLLFVALGAIFVSNYLESIVDKENALKIFEEDIEKIGEEDFENNPVEAARLMRKAFDKAKKASITPEDIKRNERWDIILKRMGANLHYMKRDYSVYLAEIFTLKRQRATMTDSSEIIKTDSEIKLLVEDRDTIQSVINIYKDFDTTQNNQ